MMDLVILGLAAFFFGRHFDQLDLDFSQNQENPDEESPSTIPAKFTEWTLVQEAQDAKSDGTVTYSLYERRYVQGDRLLFTQYKIEKNGSLFRSGYRDYPTAIEEFNEMIRPRTPEEQAQFEETLARKNFKVHTMYSPRGQAVTVTSYDQHLALESQGYTHEPPANTMNLIDRGRQKGGVM